MRKGENKKEILKNPPVERKFRRADNENHIIRRATTKSFLISQDESRLFGLFRKNRYSSGAIRVMPPT